MGMFDTDLKSISQLLIKGIGRHHQHALYLITPFRVLFKSGFALFAKLSVFYLINEAMRVMFAAPSESIPAVFHLYHPPLANRWPFCKVSRRACSQPARSASVVMRA